jgi:hypothetical protein
MLEVFMPQKLANVTNQGSPHSTPKLIIKTFTHRSICGKPQGFLLYPLAITTAESKKTTRRALLESRKRSCEKRAALTDAMMF